MHYLPENVRDLKYIRVLLTLTHFVLLFGKEEKDECNKTEKGTEIMMSFPDFEPGILTLPNHGSRRCRSLS